MLATQTSHLSPMSAALPRTFYDRDPARVARELLGMHLVVRDVEELMTFLAAAAGIAGDAEPGTLGSVPLESSSPRSVTKRAQEGGLQRIRE